MTVEVFWGSGSPFAWRDLLALEFKGSAYTAHQLSSTDRAHEKPSYPAVDPPGQTRSLPGYERVYPPHWREND